MVTDKKPASQAVFRAIADPTRRRILHLLREGGAGREEGRTVGEIAEHFSISRPAISRHLRLLRRAGLVATRKSGTATRCQLDGRPLRAVSEWLKEYQVFWDQNLRNLKRFVEENNL